MEDFNKALLVCVLFLSVFSAMPSEWLGGGWDFNFHYVKALGPPFSHDATFLANYPSLFHWFAQFFTFRELTFKLFGLLMLGLIIPLLLFKLSKDWFSVVLYFTVTSFFYFFEQGIYAQALALILMLVVLIWKHPLIRLPALFLGLLAHPSGFQLVLIALVASLLHESGLIEKAINEFKYVFLGCSGWFPVTEEGVNTRPDELLDVSLSKPVVEGPAGTGLCVYSLLKLFVDIMPFPFLYWGLKHTWKNKEYGLLLLAFIALIVGGFGGPRGFRIFFVLPLVLIPGLTVFYRGLAGRRKQGFLVLIILNGLLQFFVWWRFKVLCYPVLGLG